MTNQHNNQIWAVINTALKFFSISLVLLFVACDSENDVEIRDAGNFANGVFILNEGAFQASNASVSFIPDIADTVQGGLFKEANGSQSILGDVLMDMVSVDTLSFLVLNGSHSVMVVNNKNFEYVAEITDGIDNPRYAVVHNELVYVTQWGNDGEVVVIDPAGISVVSSIPAGDGPEGISVINNELWVANSGGYDLDNTISVIDVSAGNLKSAIEVGDCPKNMVEDANGDVWVVCSGYTNWGTGESTVPYLNKIEASTGEVVQSFEVDAGVYGQPSKIALSPNGSSIYFGGGYGISGIWKMDVESTELPTEAFIDESPYGLDVNPANGDLYLGIAPSFTDPGYVMVYGENGSEIALYNENIGVGPNKFVFVSE